MVRKVLSAILAVSLVIGMSVGAFAATGYVVTGDGPTSDSGAGGSTGADSYGSGTTTTTINEPYVPLAGLPGSPAITPTLTETQAVNAVSAAAKNASAGQKFSVSIQNNSKATLATLKAAFNAAGANAANMTINFDQVVNGVVIGRVYVTQALLATLPDVVDLTVAYSAQNTVDLFNKNFSNVNTVLGVGCANLPVAIKMAKPATNSDTLVFYSYDAISNTYSVIKTPAWTIDANGYLRFTAPVAGNIVVSNGPLSK